MITANNVSIDSRKNLRYISEHKSVFDLEYFYPLDIFENFVKQAEGWGLECSCKIDEDRIYAARFNLFYNNPHLEQFKAIQNFFDQVETRVDVNLNYQLFQKFLGNDFDFSKVKKILTGVDLRKEFTASRLKLWFIIEDYPERLERAIFLCGDNQDLRSLYVYNHWLIGFDFYLNGRSLVELYPSINREDFGRIDIQLKLAEILSPPALQLLDACSSVFIGFSKDNRDKIIYLCLLNPNEFICNLRNDIANRVHAYYREQSLLSTIVCLSEQELLAGGIQKFNLYYQMI